MYPISSAGMPDQLPAAPGSLRLSEAWVRLNSASPSCSPPQLAGGGAGHLDSQPLRSELTKDGVGDSSIAVMICPDALKRGNQRMFWSAFMVAVRPEVVSMEALESVI